MTTLRERLDETEAFGSWRQHSDVTMEHWMLLRRHIVESGFDLDAEMTQDVARKVAKRIAERAVAEWELTHKLSDGERDWLTLYLMARVIPTVPV